MEEELSHLPSRATASRLAPSLHALEQLGADHLRELVAAATRLAVWADHIAALTAAALARCGELSAAPDADSPRDVVHVEANRFATATEVSWRLGISRTRAGHLVERGLALTAPHLAPAEALARAGLLDAGKARIVCERLDGAAPALALAVQDKVLPPAPRRTHSQLARDLDRALTALDPEGTAERRQVNESRRQVGSPRPEAEGMVSMRMLLPTMDAYLVDATLDAVAAGARATGDERTLGQLRADALVSLCLHALGRGCEEARRTGLPHTPEDGATRSRPDGVPLGSLLTELAALVEDADPWWMPSGHRAPVLPPGLCVHVDVTTPLDQLLAPFPDQPPAHARTGGPTSGRTDSATGGRIGRRSCDPVTGPSSSAPSSAGPVSGWDRAAVARTAAAAGVPTVAGAGPVPAVTAQALAAGGTWRRLVTDPVTGTVLDVGRSRYRPPPDLARAVRARDRHCRAPGCEVPARRCDLDHVTAWSEGGTTSYDNLVTLCRAHHRLKHTPGWVLTVTRASGPRDGALTPATVTLTWTTPTGASYRCDPDGTVHLVTPTGKRPGDGRWCADARTAAARATGRGRGADADRATGDCGAAGQADPAGPSTGPVGSTGQTDPERSVPVSLPRQVVDRLVDAVSSQGRDLVGALEPHPEADPWFVPAVHPLPGSLGSPQRAAVESLDLAPLVDTLPPF